MAKTVGLTDAELQAVKSTWALVMSTNVAKTAGGLLLAWFEKDLSATRLFPKLSGKSLEELRKFPRVYSHGTHIFEAINAIVLNLEDEAIAEQLLLDCKRDHLNIRETIPHEDYKAFTSVAAGYLANALGEHFTAKAGSGWTKMFATLGTAGGIHQ